MVYHHDPPWYLLPKWETNPLPPTPPRLNPIGEALRRAVLAMDHSGPVTVGQSRVASGDGWDMMGWHGRLLGSIVIKHEGINHPN